MTQRKAILAWTLSVAFLIPACLSFAQVPGASGQDGVKIGAIRQQLVAPPDFGAFVTGTGNRSSALAEERLWWEQYAPESGSMLNSRQTPWSIVAYEPYEALKPTP